jgi:hypothetical protein
MHRFYPNDNHPDKDPIDLVVVLPPQIQLQNYDSYASLLY